MYNPDTEMIFPIRVIQELQSLRGKTWQSLVLNITEPPAVELEQLSFVLFMVRMAGCITCNSDAFRAMKGCTQCAMQSIRRFRGEDAELIQQYILAKEEIQNYLTRKDITF
jgi:hypothetical protein